MVEFTLRSEGLQCLSGGRAIAGPVSGQSSSLEQASYCVADHVGEARFAFGETPVSKCAVRLSTPQHKVEHALGCVMDASILSAAPHVQHWGSHICVV